MCVEFRIRFDSVSHGWLQGEIAIGEHAFPFVAEHTPNDPLLDLARLGCGLATGAPDCECVLHDGPQGLVLSVQFDATDGAQIVVFELARRGRLPVAGTVIDRHASARSIWRALRGLRGLLSDEHIAQHWPRGFPDAEVRHLGTLLGKVPR